MPIRQCPECGAKVEVPAGQRPVCHACGHGAPPEEVATPSVRDEGALRQEKAREPIPPLAWVGIAIGVLAILIAIVAAFV